MFISNRHAKLEFPKLNPKEEECCCEKEEEQKEQKKELKCDCCADTAFDKKVSQT